MILQSVLRCLSLLCLLLICGCVQKTVAGDASVYTYDLNSILMAVAGFTAALGYGVYRISQKEYWSGGIIVLMALGVGGFMIPGLWGDSLKITPERMTLTRVGFAAEKSTDLQFDDINHVTITMKETRGRRGRKNKNYYLNCSLKSSEVKVVPIGELLEKGLGEIIENLQSRQIMIVDNSGN